MKIKAKNINKSIRLNRSTSLRLSPEEKEMFESNKLVIQFKERELIPVMLNKDGEPMVKLSTMTSFMGIDWIAEYPNLPGLVGIGSTVSAAIKNLKYNLPHHIEVMKSLKLTIPKEFQ